MTDTYSLSRPAPAPVREERVPACKVYCQGKPTGTIEHLSDISEILNEPDSLVWFDIVDPKPDDLAVLEAEFDLHPLAIEDAVDAHERPKIEAYGAYWFVVVIAVTLTSEHDLLFHEVAIFAGEKFLVTVRHDPTFDLREVEKRWDAHPEELRKGGGFLLYTILDTVVDGFFPVAEAFQDRVDRLEEGLFEDRVLDGSVMRGIFELKRKGQEFRRAALPMRDILNPIIRGDISLFPSEEITYFRDVYDHAVRVIDQLDNLRDLMASALEIHLSVISNRQNETTTQLTIMATIFLPLSFVVGFFGQNFSFLVDHISGSGAFWFLGMGTEVIAVLAMLAYFKVRRWF